jgi:hypothetical protein
VVYDEKDLEKAAKAKQQEDDDENNTKSNLSKPYPQGTAATTTDLVRLPLDLFALAALPFGTIVK